MWTKIFMILTICSGVIVFRAGPGLWRAFRKKVLLDREIVLFQYTAETCEAKLFRHHRIARWIIYSCGFFSLTMMSSGLQGLIVGFDTFTLIIMVVSVCAVAILIIPSLFSMPWIREIEAELIQRSIPIPGGVKIEERIKKTTLKVMFLAFCIVIVPPLIRKLME